MLWFSNLKTPPFAARLLPSPGKSSASPEQNLSFSQLPKLLNNSRLLSHHASLSSSLTDSSPLISRLSHAPIVGSSIMPRSPIGYLVPVNQNLEEEASLPKLPLAQGPNSLGRNDVSVPDKRLSRQHIALTASLDGSANLLVEGTNPVIVRSGDRRRKLSSRENAMISNGDVIELIPGNHFFKYVTSVGGAKRTSNEVSGISRNKEIKQKRARHHDSEDNVKSMDNSKKERRGNGTGKCEEAIRSFHFPSDKLPYTFRLLRVKGLPSWANTNCVSIGDVIQGDITAAVLSNYMVDIDWLMSSCPKLGNIPHVLVIHGEGDARTDLMKRSKPSHWILHKPPLPISFGTHHSKAMLLVYPRGVRIIVHTANLIHVDWNYKSQGLWMQDFPWKDENTTKKGCGFENDLIDYLSALKWPEFTANLPSLGKVNINVSFFRKFDYSNAAVRLIGSVPGYHTGSNLKKWGHMKLRTILEECVFDKEFQRAPLIYQFSSLGSLDEKWMSEFAQSMSSGRSEDKTPLGLGDPRIIWPTVEDVRCSLEGYAAGSCIPSPFKNVEKKFLKKYWAKWKASHTGHCRAMPHIKTFARYNGQKLAWFLLTSSNLSKAAWGALQKNNSQLMVRSYELGVLFLPSHIKGKGCQFSCTDNGGPSEGGNGLTENSEARKTKLVTLTWDGSKTSEVIQLPVPYELPPEPYSSEDEPWSWDRTYNKKDVYGRVWP